jgi:uncharacterized protein YerC
VTAELRRVRLRDVDVERLWQLEQHHEAMLRELTLIAIGAETGEAVATPQKVLRLVGRARDQLMAQREGLFEQARAATDRGDETVTLEIELPAEAAAVIEEAADAYDLADDFCRAGDLLTLASPPEVAALRRDLCARITEQLRSPA